MVRLREIPRTAAFAWSPGAGSPALVTGTKAGAVDAEFSNDTTLELWDLGLDNLQPSGGDLQAAGSVNTDSRFHDIAWSRPTGDRSRGVIAGALESGALEIWDAEKLRSSPADAQVSKTVKHSGAAKAVQFNHFRNELLATAGAKGELYIWDLNNIANPFRLGASAARADDYECIDWNKGEKVPHILATGSSGGFVTIWDVRGKKENLSLNNMGRKAVSAVSWDPNAATRLITAVPNDQDPVILVWDLRNSNAPERTLKGHELGVLSLDWCHQDSSLLLSCGKDNRTICWNPHTGQAYGEFPVVTNWTFQTRWNPHNPNLFATASFDGKISIQNTQNTNPKAETQAASGPAADGEDFFAQSQTRPQGPSFSLPIAPKWQKRPIGASFGFGGKIVTFKSDPATSKSQVAIKTFAVDSAIPEAAKQFEDAIKSGDIASFCEKKITEATDEEEKADWQVIETLSAGGSRKKLSEYLGLSTQVDSTTTNGETLKSETNGAKDDDDDFFGGAGGDSDNFLANLASNKGAKTNEPFSLHIESESEADKGVTSALILGDFDKALDICLADKRLSDAFMIAICGGQKCIDKVQRAYLKEKAAGPSYLRLLASIVGKNLWDVVHNADLADWKEVMATLCTFAEEKEFSDLCEALGDRLEEAIGSGDATSTYRRDASFCYLAGSKLEKVVNIWTQELREKETESLKSGEGDSSFSVHARSLQDFIEKVTVFRQVTNFQDPDKSATADWKLGPLYSKYTEYADILAAHGQLEVAEKYLDLLPAKYPLAEVAQQRVRRATSRPTTQAATRQSATAGLRIGQRAPAPGLPTAATSGPFGTSAGSNNYAPAAAGHAPMQPTGPYAPAGAPAPTQPIGPYAPAGYGAQAGYQPPGQSQQQYGGPTPYGGGYQPPQAAPAPPPPRAGGPSGVPPPPRAGAAGGPNWNDTPDNFFKPPQVSSRKGTPGPVAVASPFPNQPSIASPPPSAGPGGFSQPKASPLPPPPKAGQSTPRGESPTVANLPARPPSAAANAYAPPSGAAAATLGPSGQPHGAPPVMRGASPFSQPPSGGAPTNRYAPAPSAQPAGPAPGMQPPRNVAPPPNPYARAPSNYMARPMGDLATNQPVGPQAGPPPAQGHGAPPPGPPRAGPPGGPPRQDTPGAPPPTARPTPPPPQTKKHAPGDRSHIPPEAQPIYELLAADMARVKAKAPATYAPQVNDTEKRLNILFDHLNNSDLLKADTVQQMVEISHCIQSRDMNRAGEILTDMMKSKLESEGGNWMVGVKRLIAMSRATPV